MMRRLRQSQPDPEPDDEPTPAGVDLAGRYGYPAAAKAHGKANGGDIRRAYGARFELLYVRRGRRR